MDGVLETMNIHSEEKLCYYCYVFPFTLSFFLPTSFLLDARPKKPFGRIK